MDYSVTKNGKPLDESLYTLDEETKVFSTNENELVLDFSCMDGVSFNTGYNCTFTTGSNCTFKTGYNCTFTTGSNCTFNTSYNCSFMTGNYCTFTTSSNCSFMTGNYCTFTTGSYCTFNTGSDGTFNTGYNCTFNVWYALKITLVENVVIMVKYNDKTKVYNLNDYYRPELEGFQVAEVELDRLKSFPLDEPRYLILHVKDELGKRLFEHYQKKGLL